MRLYSLIAYGRALTTNGLFVAGPIDTPLLHQHFANTEQEEQSLDEVIERIPMGRIGSPREVANVVGFLLGSESSFVTVSKFSLF